MTTPVWPPSLPQDFDLEGFQLSQRDAVQATEMEAGNRKRRRNKPSAPKNMTVAVTLSAADYLTVFEPWFEDTLRDGELEFDMPHPISEGDTLRVAFKAGEPPDAAPRQSGLYVRVTMKLEIPKLQPV